MTVALPMADGILLGYALVADILRRNRARGLFIKGPALVALGIAKKRVSTDVDVLTAPGDFEFLISELESRGWEARPTSYAPRFFPIHSVSLFHPNWPCDIDVHRHYPGVFVDPAIAFERLWDERATVQVGGNSLFAAGPVGMSLVVALHAARDPERPRSATDVQAVARFLQDRGLAAEFVSLAHDLRAAGPLVHVERLLEVDFGAHTNTDAELEAWRLLVANLSETSVFHWWIALRRGRLRDALPLMRFAAREAVRRITGGEGMLRAWGLGSVEASGQPPRMRPSRVVANVRMSIRRYEVLNQLHRQRAADQAAVSILHVTECYAGGVRRVLDGIVEAYPSARHHLLWSDPEGDEVGVHPGFETQTQLPQGTIARIAAVRLAVNRLSPDFVHAHSSWGGLYTRLRSLGVPVIYEPHCYKFDDPTASALLRWTVRMVEARLLKQTRTTVVLSAREERLTRRLKPNARTDFVPNVASLDRNFTIDRTLPTNSRPTVVMVGRISKQKDPEFFARVAELVRQSLPGARFVWIGTGDQACLPSFVEVTGWVTPVELASLLDDDVVYFHSAAYEGFPVSVLDAAARGVPIIVRRIPAFEGTPLVQREGEQDVAAALVQVLRGGPLRAQALEASRLLTDAMSPGARRAALENLYGIRGNSS